MVLSQSMCFTSRKSADNPQVAEMKALHVQTHVDDCTVGCNIAKSHGALLLWLQVNLSGVGDGGASRPDGDCHRPHVGRRSRGAAAAHLRG